MALTDVTSAILATVSNEGGWVCDPNDPGGETAHGITRPNWPQWSGWALVDTAKKKAGVPSNNKATITQIKKLNTLLWADDTYKAAVVSFYKQNYWDKVRGDEFTDIQVAHSIFDFAVNAGVGAAIKVAKVAAHLNADTATLDDNSLHDICVMPSDYFLARFTLGKIARYAGICEKRPTSKVYFYGWVSRALREM